MKKIFLLLLIFICGCSTNVVVKQNGYPLPGISYYLVNSSGLTATFNWCRLYEKSKESYYPEYFDMFKKQTIPLSKTKELVINLLVINPNKRKFKLIKTVTKSKGVYQISYSETIFEGNPEDKIFQLNCPLEKGFNYTVEAIVKTNETHMIHIGEFIYSAE